jgi:hypothetical protein
MVSSVSVFTNPAVAVSEFVKELAHSFRTVHHVERNEGGQQIYVVTTTMADLIVYDDHGVTTDLGIPFDEFKVQIRVSPHREAYDADTCDKVAQTIGNRLFSYCSHTLQQKSILVYNLQKLIRET